jgi:hypothetical protein
VSIGTSSSRGAEGRMGVVSGGIVLVCGRRTLIIQDPVVLKLCWDDLLLLEL